MKQQFLFVLALCFFAVIDAKAGGIPIIFSYGDEFEEVMELPSDFVIEYNNNNYHADLGIKHKQISILWIPVYNYGEEVYVLYAEKDGDYIYSELHGEDLKAMQDRFGVNMVPLEPSLSFWNVWGGKLLFLFIIFIFWAVGQADSEEEEGKSSTSPS